MELRNPNPSPVVLGCFPKLATICGVAPESIKERKEVSLVKVRPGITEVVMWETAIVSQVRGSTLSCVTKAMA